MFALRQLKQLYSKEILWLQKFKFQRNFELSLRLMLEMLRNLNYWRKSFVHFDVPHGLSASLAFGQKGVKGILKCGRKAFVQFVVPYGLPAPLTFGQKGAEVIVKCGRKVFVHFVVALLAPLAFG